MNRFACECREFDAGPRWFAEDTAEDAEGEEAVDTDCDGFADGWGRVATRMGVEGPGDVVGCRWRYGTGDAGEEGFFGWERGVDCFKGGQNVVWWRRWFYFVFRVGCFRGGFDGFGWSTWGCWG